MTAIDVVTAEIAKAEAYLIGNVGKSKWKKMSRKRAKIDPP